MSSGKAFCFCDQCRGEVRWHGTTIQRHFERQDILSSSFEDRDASFATRTEESDSEFGTGRGSHDFDLSDTTSREDHDLPDSSSTCGGRLSGSCSDDEFYLDDSYDTSREEAQVY